MPLKQPARQQPADKSPMAKARWQHRTVSTGVCADRRLCRQALDCPPSQSGHPCPVSSVNDLPQPAFLCRSSIGARPIPCVRFLVLPPFLNGRGAPLSIAAVPMAAMLPVAMLPARTGFLFMYALDTDYLSGCFTVKIHMSLLQTDVAAARLTRRREAHTFAGHGTVPVTSSGTDR